MILDNLLTFADGKEIPAKSEAQAVVSDVVDVGKEGDEIARTLNLVVQIDDCKDVTSTTSTITATLEKAPSGTSNFAPVFSFTSTLGECKSNGRIVNFAKLPLGGMGGAMRVRIEVGALTVAQNGVNPKWSAWLTPSAEA